MSSNNFAQVVEDIRKEDARFDKGAYFFVRQGLDHTIKQLKDSPERASNHVTGPELLSGIREFALDQYGPMAFTLLDTWGVKRCEDIGDIVFNLVEAGVLGKTESDKREDFSGGYDFEEAFKKPFQPQKRAGEQN